MNFSNTFVSVLLVSISVASATIAHENCTSDTMYFFFIALRTHISLLCFSDTYFATHSPRIYFINLGHSSLSISKNSNRGTCYRGWTLHPLSILYFFTASRKMIDQKDFRNRGLLNMSPLNFSIYKLYNLELTLSHSCSN